MAGKSHLGPPRSVTRTVLSMEPVTSRAARGKNHTGKTSMLTLERLREVLSYDPETGVWRWLVKRGNSVPVGRRAGCASAERGYRTIGIDGAYYQSAQLAVFYMTGQMPAADVDHRDLDKLNDRWENLREATRSQNRANTPPPVTNTTGLKGAYRKKGCHTNPFGSQITIRGRKHHLGYYPTIEEAHAAYMQAAERGFGEFARGE